jgi:hypothetical protein
VCPGIFRTNLQLNFEILRIQKCKTQEHWINFGIHLKNLKNFYEAEKTSIFKNAEKTWHIFLVSKE